MTTGSGMRSARRSRWGRAGRALAVPDAAGPRSVGCRSRSACDLRDHSAAARALDTQAPLTVLMDPGERVTWSRSCPRCWRGCSTPVLRQPPSLRWALLGGDRSLRGCSSAPAARGVPVAPSYGMTEACSKIANQWPAPAGVELRIADDGEVLVRGKTVAAGALAADGWLHSGDPRLVGRTGPALDRRPDATRSSPEARTCPRSRSRPYCSNTLPLPTWLVFGRPDPEWGSV